MIRLMYWICILLLCGCSCSHFGKLDPQRAIGNDYTVFMSGCGRETVVSDAILCRVIAGLTTKTEVLEFHAPPDSDCKGEHCTYVKIFFPDGRPALEKSIPKGQSTLNVPWSEMMGKESFDLTDRGLFSVTVEMHYLDPQGEERRMYMEGMIFLRVISPSYTSLELSEDDENFYWVWKEKKQTLKLTTGGRAYVGPKP
jgi:hypothetical protein